MPHPTCAANECEKLGVHEGKCRKHWNQDLKARGITCVHPGCHLGIRYANPYRCYKHAKQYAPTRIPLPRTPEEDREVLLTCHTKTTKEFNGTPCWTWTGKTSPAGYGRLTFSTGGRLAHRRSHEVFKGPIPDGLQIDHLCRNRACCNPDHLEAVTRKENILRGENFTARNARATHCPKGHPYDEDNTYQAPGKRLNRDCKACNRLAAKAPKPPWTEAQREAAVQRWLKREVCSNGHKIESEEDVWASVKSRRSGCLTCRRAASLRFQRKNTSL